MFQREREHCRRKVIGNSNKSHREKHQLSRVPMVETFEPICVFVPINGPQKVFERGIVHTKPTKFTPDGDRQTGTIHSLVAKYPIFDSFQTHHGGGRTGGGGTSEKTLAEAKRKIKHSSKLELSKAPKKRKVWSGIRSKKPSFDDYDY